eukprot:1932188-Rhodomonas_salina.2
MLSRYPGGLVPRGARSWVPVAMYGSVPSNACAWHHTGQYRAAPLVQARSTTHACSTIAHVPGGSTTRTVRHGLIQPRSVPGVAQRTLGQYRACYQARDRRWYLALGLSLPVAIAQRLARTSTPSVSTGHRAARHHTPYRASRSTQDAECTRRSASTAHDPARHRHAPCQSQHVASQHAHRQAITRGQGTRSTSAVPKSMRCSWPPDPTRETAKFSGFTSRCT